MTSIRKYEEPSERNKGSSRTKNENNNNNNGDSSRRSPHENSKGPYPNNLKNNNNHNNTSINNCNYLSENSREYYPADSKSRQKKPSSNELSNLKKKNKNKKQKNDVTWSDLMSPQMESFLMMQSPFNSSRSKRADDLKHVQYEEIMNARSLPVSLQKGEMKEILEDSSVNEFIEEEEEGGETDKNRGPNVRKNINFILATNGGQSENIKVVRYFYFKKKHIFISNQIFVIFILSIKSFYI